MNVHIKIKFTSQAGNVTKKGNFQLKGKTIEETALIWWKTIRREVFAEELIEVTVNNEDITDKIKPYL